MKLQLCLKTHFLKKSHTGDAQAKDSGESIATENSYISIERSRVKLANS